jgi:predicted nucleic acid-binding protein
MGEVSLGSGGRIRAKDGRESAGAAGIPCGSDAAVRREALSMTDALADVGRFSTSFAVLEDGPEVTAQLIELCRRVQLGGRQVHDANIVATMLARGENRLLTMNRGDFRRFEPRIEIVEP